MGWKCESWFFLQKEAKRAWHVGLPMYAMEIVRFTKPVICTWSAASACI